MTRMLSFGLVVVLLILLEPVYAVADDTADKSTAIGTVPADAAGRPLNLGFETGTLADWTAEGSAFRGTADRGRHGQPPTRRHAQRSRGPVLGRNLRKKWRRRQGER